MAQIIFILVKPAVPANVGAVARAMKTMGFANLRLVTPCDHLCMEARMLAHASNELLENAEVYPGLPEALHDIDFVIGTTARKRTIRNRFIPLEELPEIIKSKGNTIQKAAIVFGSEESGLSNSEVDCCHLLSTISMATKYPSLNLAQAAMVYAYELSVLSGKQNKKSITRQNPESLLVLRNRAEEILDLLGMPVGDLIRTKILERISLLGEKDVYLLHSVSSKFLKKIEH